MQAIRYTPRNFSDLELDLIALERIEPEVLKREAALYQTKWWDYRFLHPTEATYAFAQSYERAYRRLYAKRYDKFEAETVAVFNNADALKDTKTTVVGLWMARQKADELGIRYDSWCFPALDYSERVFDKLARTPELVLPNVVEHIEHQWLVRNIAGLVQPEAIQYRNEAWAEHPYVREWRDLVAARKKAGSLFSSMP